MEEDSKPFTIKSGNPYEILFLEPAYVSAIEIQFSKSILGAGIELSVLDSLSNRSVRRRVAEDLLSANITFAVKCVSTGISILLQPSLFELFGKRTLEIKYVKITGYLLGDFDSLTASLAQLQGLRDSAIAELSEERRELQSRDDRVQQRETAVSQLESQTKEELSDLETSLQEVEAAKETAEAKLTTLREAIATAETRKQVLGEQVSTYEATARSIDGEISKGKEQLRSLAVQTSENETRLRDLTNNVHLFSEEFSSFSDHGAKQTKTFIYLSIAPLAIIAFLTGQLLIGAVDLSVKYVKEPNLDMMTVFVTRLPYLTVCGSILAVCYSAINFLFNRISVIYAERLDFAKIGILAKDVASASAHGLSLDDGQLYEARTYLKIEMLKSYLSENIGSFIYKRRESRSGNGAENKDNGPNVSSSESSEPEEHAE
jgi:hypothetical protein